MVRLQTAIISENYRAFHRFGQGKFPNGGLVLDCPSCLQKWCSVQERSKLTQK